MYFWLKVLHILAMTVWFTGLFFLPRLFVARHRREIDSDPEYWNPVTNTLFFRIMTPAALVTITLGGILIAGSVGWTDKAALEAQRELADQVFGSADALEGARAFAEKRAPVWRGE